jgi:hypothetical protein
MDQINIEELTDVVCLPPGIKLNIMRDKVSLVPGTKVMLFDGSVIPIEQVRLGFQLMGADQRPIVVAETSQGSGEMYRVFPSKGRSFMCSGDCMMTLTGAPPHIKFRKEKNSFLVIYTERGIEKSRSFKTVEDAQQYAVTVPEDIFIITLREYMRRSKNQNHHCYLFHVGLTFPGQPVPIDPYLIGYWLGDGTSATPSITTADPEILALFDERIKQYNLELVPRDKITFYMRAMNGTRKNPFLMTLRQLDMLNNKHIPDLYKKNSREVRLQILAGLIDSDGHVYGEGNCITIVQKNVHLSDDIEYLAFSLGFMVTRVQCVNGCMYKGEMRYGVYQKCCIFGEGLEEIPTILERKICRIRRINKRATYYGLTIESAGIGTYCKLQFATPGNFLLDDFLVM